MRTDAERPAKGDVDIVLAFASPKHAGDYDMTELTDQLASLATSPCCNMHSGLLNHFKLDPHEPRLKLLLKALWSHAITLPSRHYRSWSHGSCKKGGRRNAAWPVPVLGSKNRKIAWSTETNFKAGRHVRHSRQTEYMC